MVGSISFHSLVQIVQSIWNHIRTVYYYTINPKKWSFPTGKAIDSSPAIGQDGTIYIGSGDGNLYAINPDGTKKWRFQIGGYGDSSPAIGADGTIYIRADSDNFYAINPDGTKKWRFQIGGYGDSSPAIGADGTIYIGSGDGNLYAINPDGTKKWELLTLGNNDFFDYTGCFPLIASDGTIYMESGSVESDNYNLYAINPDGTKKWELTIPITGIVDYFDYFPVIGSDGTIYVGSGDGLYAISPNGTEKWIFPTSMVMGNRIGSSPAIGSDGMIYVGTESGRLRVIYGGSGMPAGTLLDSPDCPIDLICYSDHFIQTETWRFQIGCCDIRSSPAIGPDGTIYVGSGDGNLYAINGNAGGLADAPWPMFRHDLRHTGRANFVNA